MRAALQLFFTFQGAMLGFIAVVAVWLLLPGIERVPQAIAATALALALVGVYPLMMPAPAIRAAVRRWAASPRLQRWIEPVQPFQFAAVVLVLVVAGVERLPRWVPVVVDTLRADLATRDFGETVVVWTVLGLLGAAGVLLVLTFAAVLTAEALGFAAAPSSTEAGNTVQLWNVLTTALAVITETTDLFSGVRSGPEDWRWWLNLGFSLAIARSMLVVWTLFASDHVAAPLDAALAHKALGARIGRRATAVGLVGAILGFLVLERALGVAGAGAVVALVSAPVARALERVAPARGSGGSRS